jgi:hypothetical protein
MKKLLYTLKMITAEEITVEKTDVPPSPTVKEIGKDRPKNLKDLARISDDKKIYWKEVRSKFPEIADFLNKNLFKGKKELTVKELKERIQTFNVEDADRYWISLDKWDGMQRELSEPQMVVQLNLSEKTFKEIKEHPVATDFFDDFFKSFSGGLHPMHENTLAWARVYKFPEKWVIEEIQSDLFGADTKVEKRAANQKINDILESFSPEEVAKLGAFLNDKFTDWDKQIVSAIFEMARKEGVKELWLFDEDIKKKVLTSKSKLKRFYKVIPRDFGFKKEVFKEGNREIPAWRRVVARKRAV